MQIRHIPIFVSLVLAGCASAPNYQTDRSSLPVAQQWAGDLEAESFDMSQWQDVITPELKTTISQVLENNFQLKEQELALAASERGLVASGAPLFPSLDAGLVSSRRKSQPSGDIGDGNSLTLDFRYEVDIWGKLSDNHRQANLLYQAQETELTRFKSELIRNVIESWFRITESQQQLTLNRLRLKNSQQNLEIIEAGYESGLNSALDVYLTRNEVANEISRVADQQAVYKANVRNLELLLGSYPGAKLSNGEAAIPAIKAQTAIGLPSELIARKPELKANWISVLAKDAEVAFRYKQRFPSITLSGSAGTTSEDLSDLLSSSIAWSLIGSLTAPLFDAGTLKANEEKARYELAQSEQNYLQALYSAFAEVENSLTSQTSLQESYLANIEAAENATFAETLSFDQYQKGLVSYTTVLESQTRAFNAQSAVIQLRYQLLENHLRLFSALGGDFDALYAQVN